MAKVPAMSEAPWTVEDHLRGRDPTVIGLYERFVELVKACGPFELAVSKTAITFKGSRRGFAGAKPKVGWLDGYLDVQRRLEDPRIRSASPYTKRLFTHQFRVTALDQLDDEFAAWVREAYAVGQGRHLLKGPPQN
jgi:hypothetical protein